MTWIRRIRLKTLAWLVGIALATIASISFAGAPALPVIGVAVAAAAVGVSKFAAKLSRATCLICGTDLAVEPLGEHGVVCPKCGGVHQPGFLERAARHRSSGRSI